MARLLSASGGGGVELVSSPPAEAVVDYALRTFAFGLFLRPPGASLSAGREAEAEPGGEAAAQAPGSRRCDGFGSTPSRWELAAVPQEIAGAPGFTTLSCGGFSCLGLTSEGEVHRWDAGGRGAGALFRNFGVDWSLSSLKDESGQGMQLRDVAIGGGNLADTVPHVGPGTPRGASYVGAVALMDSGDVYTAEGWRSDAASSVGAASPIVSPTWQLVPCLESHLVVSVACGAGFCLATTARGELLSWGESSCGALGLGGVAAAVEPASGASGGPAWPRRERAVVPTLVPGALSRWRVAAVACGECHVIAATCDEPDHPGEVFSWGSGADGRLGYGLEGCEGEARSAVQAEPRAVSWITPALGDALCARRRSRNRSLSGASQPSRRSTLRSPQRITQLGCGTKHSVVLCQGGLICFGSDDCGQLGGNGGPSDGILLPASASAPALLAAPLDEDDPGFNGPSPAPCEVSARRICCGPLHTAAVSPDGHLHVWGLSFAESGGVGPGASEIRRVRGFGERRKPVALACGAHFVVVSAEVELPATADSHGGAHVPASSSSSRLTQSCLRGWNSCDALDDASEAWRPTNLPPKTEEELARHRALVRELDRSMQRRLEREQREDEQRRRREAQRERRVKEHTELWLREVLPSYSPGTRPSRRMELLWRQGLPPKVREILWPVAIGNVLRITPELFEIHKRQALEARRAEAAAAANALVTLTEPPCDLGGRTRERGAECIPFDLPRTFPTLAFFREGGPLHEDCARILEAFTFFRPDIGYVQGMSYLVAVLLLYLPPFPAYVGFCNIVSAPSVLGLYRLEPSAVECRARLFRQFSAAQLPAVARCIQEAGLTPEMFLIEWFMTLYAKCLPIDVASVVWDLFLLDGEVVLYYTAIALLRMSESALLGDGTGLDLEGCARVLGEDLRTRVQDSDELLWHIQEVWRRTPPQLLAEIQGIANSEFASTPAFSSGHADGTAGTPRASSQEPATRPFPRGAAVGNGIPPASSIFPPWGASKDALISRGEAALAPLAPLLASLRRRWNSGA